MILVPVESLKEDMVLGRSVFDENGGLLLAAGYHIERNVILRLCKMQFGSVWIHQEGTDDVVPEEVISEQIRLQAFTAVMDTAEIISKSMKLREDTLDSIKKEMKTTEQFKNIVVVPKVQRAVNDIIDSIIGQPDILVNLSTIRSQKTFLYNHAVDVTVIALMIGKKLNLTHEELLELGVGSILHDIGMAVIPEKIINKPDRLTFQEYNFIKEHATYGYAILRENRSIAPTSAHIAFQHHERQDGHGYPRGLTGSNRLPVKTISQEKGKIHRFSEIVAVADTYNSLTSPRPFSVQKTPEEVIKKLLIAAGTQLNHAIVDILINLVPVYPVGTYISVVEAPVKKLVGCKGVVASVKKGCLDKPVIVLINDPNGNKIESVKIDLMQYPDLKIQIIPFNKLMPPTAK